MTPDFGDWTPDLDPCLFCLFCCSPGIGVQNSPKRSDFRFWGLDPLTWIRACFGFSDCGYGAAQLITAVCPGRGRAAGGLTVLTVPSARNHFTAPAGPLASAKYTALSAVEPFNSTVQQKYLPHQNAAQSLGRSANPFVHQIHCVFRRVFNRTSTAVKRETHTKCGYRVAHL